MVFMNKFILIDIFDWIFYRFFFEDRILNWNTATLQKVGNSEIVFLLLSGSQYYSFGFALKNQVL